MQLARTKINLEKIAKESLKEKNVVVEKINEKMIKVWYKGTSIRNTPKPMILPKEILLDEEFVEGLGLYVGDGKLTPNDSVHLAFTTIDSDMGKFFFEFLKRKLFVKTKDISFIVRYRYGNENEIRQKWSKLLKISENEFVLQKTSRYEMTDNIIFQVNSKILTTIFKKIIEQALTIVKNTKTLRRAFLRGEFAADGKFAIEKDANTFYISEMTFCFNYKKERWLRDYIVDCLKLEGVNEFNENREGFIRITSWKNYIKFWEMGLLDRCERKKNKFVQVIKQMSVRFDLEKDFLMELLNSTQLSKSSLIRLLHLHRTNFKRLLNGQQFLSMEQIENIMPNSNFDWNKIIKNTKRIRIGRITSLQPQVDFINYLIENRRGEKNSIS